MLKTRSKSKLKEAATTGKRMPDDKAKKNYKQLPRRNQQQNIFPIPKLNMTAVQSKKKTKAGNQIQGSREPSPLTINRRINQTSKIYDENFIEKLFDKNYTTNQGNHNDNFFIEHLIEGLASRDSALLANKGENQMNYIESVDFNKSLHLKNQEIATLNNQINQLKINIANFTLKVFDLTVLCRKYSDYITNETESIEFNKKTDEVIAYLDLLIKRWKLQERVKNHCEGLSKKSLSHVKNNKPDNKQRCYTQSLKIPLEEYLQSLQNTQLGKFQQHCESAKKDTGQEMEEQSQELMKIVSKRSSGITKEEQDIFVVIRGFEAKNQHELSLKVGQRVSILQKNQHNKWVGLKDGKVGYFPHQCLF